MKKENWRSVLATATLPCRRSSAANRTSAANLLNKPPVFRQRYFVRPPGGQAVLDFGRSGAAEFAAPACGDGVCIVCTLAKSCQSMLGEVMGREEVHVAGISSASLLWSVPQLYSQIQTSLIGSRCSVCRICVLDLLLTYRAICRTRRVLLIT